MKLIIPWYKLIAQAFKHQDSKNVLSKGSSCTILKRRLFFFFLNFINLERKKQIGSFFKKSLGSSMPLVQGIVFKWLKGSMLLVQRLFHLKIFLFFWEIWKSWIFFCFLLLYIYTQTKLIKCYMKNLNSKKKKNIETWNKQTNFKLNYDVANQMWSEAKLGCLLLSWSIEDA